MRYVIVAGFLLITPVLGGLYGALYDQLTYSISPEFFINVRDLNPASSSPRWEVAKIGFLNTWAIGLFLGAVLSFAGLIHENAQQHIRITTQSFVLPLVLAFLFALLGMAMPCQDSNPQLSNIQDQPAFLCVLRMNNYTKVGGIIGMIFGLGWQVWKYKRIAKSR
jgi:hypothetical protein